MSGTYVVKLIYCELQRQEVSVLAGGQNTTNNGRLAAGDVDPPIELFSDNI
jgi:hypothetical protein